jgi:hypothetical protein
VQPYLEMINADSNAPRSSRCFRDGDPRKRSYHRTISPLFKPGSEAFAHVIGSLASRLFNLTMQDAYSPCYPDKRRLSQPCFAIQSRTPISTAYDAPSHLELLEAPDVNRPQLHSTSSEARYPEPGHQTSHRPSISVSSLGPLHSTASLPALPRTEHKHGYFVFAATSKSRNPFTKHRCYTIAEFACADPFLSQNYSYVATLPIASHSVSVHRQLGFSITALIAHPHHSRINKKVVSPRFRSILLF